eukprot:2459605-Karenia_brevis.AAC.1
MATAMHDDGDEDEDDCHHHTFDKFDDLDHVDEDDDNHDDDNDEMLLGKSGADVGMTAQAVRFQPDRPST